MYGGAYVSYSAIESMTKEYQKQQKKEAEKKAREQQAKLDAIARQRTALAQQQQARSRALQVQQSQQIAAQQAEATRLQGLQADRLVQIKAQAAASTAAAEKSRAESMAAGNAVASSLGVLSQAGAKQGRTASVSKKAKRRTGARQTESSLRIGATSTGSGTGSNLSI